MIFGSSRNQYFLDKIITNMTTLTDVPTPKRYASERAPTTNHKKSLEKHKSAKLNEEEQYLLGLDIQKTGTCQIQKLKKGQKASSEPLFRPKHSSRLILKNITPKDSNKINFSREEKSILALDLSLQKFKKQHSLDEKSVQIKYVNTLKKIKKTGLNLGCKIKVESKGFSLENTKEKEHQELETFNYNFGKEFNRYFKRKLVQRLETCTEGSKSLHTTMDHQVDQIKDAITLNAKKSEVYRDFTSKRMETYLKGVSTQKRKMPFCSKKGFDKAILKAKMQQDFVSNLIYKTNDTAVDNSNDKVNHPSCLDSPANHTSKTSTSERWTQLIHEYQADLVEFEEICDFFQKIQHELLRYMPNNHLSNKVNNIINQVEHSSAIRKIYDQCNLDIEVLTPQVIVKYLKQEEGILSSMNYIVNVIKLNISAERRKRFLDLEKTIGKYQQLTLESASTISDRLKTIDSPWIKKRINDTVMKTNTNCRGLDPSYLSFVKQAEEQEFSSLNSGKNRNIICEILKFQALMK